MTGAKNGLPKKLIEAVKKCGNDAVDERMKPFWLELDKIDKSSKRMVDEIVETFSDTLYGTANRITAGNLLEIRNLLPQETATSNLSKLKYSPKQIVRNFLRSVRYADTDLISTYNYAKNAGLNPREVSGAVSSYFRKHGEELTKRGYVRVKTGTLFGGPVYSYGYEKPKLAT